MKHARPQWYTSLPFLVSADEAVFKLQWRLKGVRSVDDQELAQKECGRFRGSGAGGSVPVSGGGNNGVMYAGARKLKASVSNLKDLTVRGYRIRAGHRHQTLAAYPEDL